MKMQDYLDRANTHQQNQHASGFLRTEDFRNCADLDGSLARKFFEDNGYTVLANGDLGTNGIAVTEEGWILSTNGYLTFDPLSVPEYLRRLGVKEKA